MRWAGSRRRFYRNRQDIDASALAIEVDDTVGQSEEGIIAAAAYVTAGVKACAALTDENITSLHPSSAENLDTQSLAARISTVANGTLTFLMSHVASFSLDFTSSVPVGPAS